MGDSTILSRRDFTLKSALAVLAGTTITISGCDSDSPTAPTPNPGPGGGSGTGTVSANHGHTAEITAAELTAGNRDFRFAAPRAALDGTFIHLRAAERTKFCSAHNRPTPEAVTSAHADVEPTGAAAFRAFLRHRSTLVPFRRQPSLHLAARQPAVHRQRPDPPQHLAEEPPVQMPFRQSGAR